MTLNVFLNLIFISNHLLLMCLVLCAYLSVLRVSSKLVSDGDRLHKTIGAVCMLKFPLKMKLNDSQDSPRHHHGPCVPPERVLQQPGQLGLPVGDVAGLLLAQGL